MTIDPVFHTLVVVLLSVALALFSYWTYPRGTPGRPVLLLLRMALVALVTFILLRPSWIIPRSDQLTSSLIFLADASRSMAVADEAAKRTRWEALLKDVADSAESRERLQGKVGIRFFTFADQASELPAENLTAQKPDGDRSALGDALESVLRQSSGSRIAGVVLLSDGANTAGVSPLQAARRFRSARIPIHAVGYGQEVVSTESKDLVARSIQSNPTVFAKNKLQVTGELDVSSVGASPLMVRLLVNGKEEARGEFKAAEGARRLLVDLVATPTVPGDAKITLEATTPGDPQPANNVVSTYVTVLSGGISVLEIEGKYRFWEPKYVRWALDQSPDIALEQLFMLEQTGNASFPKELLEPGRVDVYLLGDIAARQFTKEQLAQLADRVRQQGAGLLMMGGYEAFGPGGWQNTPIADVLPVIMRPADAQRTGSLPMVPTDTGLRHFILRLAPDVDQNQQAWKSLSPLDGSSSWSSLKPAAQLLAQSTGGDPLLAAQAVGAGRAIAFAGDTTWRWRRSKESIVHHARFWRQLILWLAKKEDAGSPTLKVSLPTRRIPVGRGLPISVQPVAPDGSPLPEAQIEANVVASDGTRLAVPLYRQGSEYVGTFRDSQKADDLVLEVTGKAGETDLGKTSVKFLTYAEDAESQQTAADLGLLRSITQTTGGSFLSHLELGPFLQNISLAPLDDLPTSRDLIPLWDRWEVLALFVLFVALEWGIRKRRGLV